MTAELDVNRVRDLLTRTRTLAERSARQRLNGARVLLRHARAILAQHTDDLAKDVARTLERYDGLPVTSNLIVAAGKVDSEVVHSSLLRWLLDPGGDHGLGDLMLRQVLARHRDPRGQQLALRDAPLRAAIASEVPVGNRRVDIVGVLPELLFFIEVKVHAFEEVEQCKSYRIGLESRSEQDVALRLMGEEPRETLLPVLGFFLRKRGRPGTSDLGITTDLDWLEIEEALWLSERRTQLPPGAAHALRSVRSLLLEHSGAERPPMPTIQKLRRYLDVPAATRHDPLGTLLLFREHLNSTERTP